MQTENKTTNNKGDRNKVYFLIIVIAALIGINGYLFIKERQQKEKFVSVSAEKDRLKLEVEKIEVELDRVNLLNVTLNDQLVAEQNFAREKIAALKLALKKGKLTPKDIDNASSEILKLREFVKTYNNQIISLEQENSYLKNERDSLKATLNNNSGQAEALRKENQNLAKKLKAGAVLKTNEIKIAAYKVRDNGKLQEVVKANAANKLTINFSIVDNELAEQKQRKVYLRVFDPAGNLMADQENIFDANGQQMQFSAAADISFYNEASKYKIDWVNPKAFSKGSYAVHLYTDGQLMGKSEIKLN